MGLKALPRHFLHLTFFSNIFLGSDLNLDLHFLQIKIFLYNLACAAGSLVAI